MQDLKILQKSAELHEARWWEAQPGGKVHCYLCPRHCHIGEGQSGFCYIRANDGGKLYSLGYAHPAAMQVDPIENTRVPGRKWFRGFFSIGSTCIAAGCA